MLFPLDNCLNKTPSAIVAQEENILLFVCLYANKHAFCVYIDRLTVFSRFLLCSGASFMTLALGKLRPPAKLMQTILNELASSKSRSVRSNYNNQCMKSRILVDCTCVCSTTRMIQFDS